MKTLPHTLRMCTHVDILMGISRLFSCCAPVARPRNLRDMAGACVGIDGNIWVHRSMHGSVGASQGSLEEAQIRYFVRRARSFLEMGVIPIFVFDGAELPAKAHTRLTRIFQRATNSARSISQREHGETIKSAHGLYSKQVPHSLVNHICSALRMMGVESYIAPYETDPQLVHMLHEGIIEAIVTEDSDLLVYGSSRTISKVDTSTGMGIEITQPLLAPALRGLSQHGLQLAAILAGCDYGPNIVGIGIKKAIDIGRQCERYLENDIRLNERLVDILTSQGYEIARRDSFLAAIKISQSVFKHQTIFDEAIGRLQPLTKEGYQGVSPNIQKYLGAFYSDSLAADVFSGNVAAGSLEKFEPTLDIPGLVDTELSRYSNIVTMASMSLKHISIH
jgi:exonuclease 1